MFDKLKFYDGTCFPVVSTRGAAASPRAASRGPTASTAEAATSRGSTRRACNRGALPQADLDKTHPEVKCAAAGLRVPRAARVRCKGSQQFLCVQNRVACPCDDEVPSTCTICGFQKCRNQRGTVHKLELIPFLPFPQVRVEEEMERIQGGHDEKLHVPWYAACCNDAATATHADFRQLFACYGANITGGWDFPACCGANIVGTLACCLGIDFVFLKPVDEHRRVRYMLIQGHGYVQDPKDRI